TRTFWDDGARRVENSDGTGYAYMRGAHGRYREQHWGPSPPQNYRSSEDEVSRDQAFFDLSTSGRIASPVGRQAVIGALQAAEHDGWGEHSVVVKMNAALERERSPYRVRVVSASGDNTSCRRLEIFNHSGTVTDSF